MVLANYSNTSSPVLFLTRHTARPTGKSQYTTYISPVTTRPPLAIKYLAPYIFEANPSTVLQKCPYNNKIGEVFYKSFEDVLKKDFLQIIIFFRDLNSLHLDKVIWNWGGIKMSPINFARWAALIDNNQPFIQSQEDVDIWKDCLIRLPISEVENTLKLLRTQNASLKQISAVEAFLTS